MDLSHFFLDHHSLVPHSSLYQLDPPLSQARFFLE